MKWSWKIGTLAGIDLRVHATFLLLPLWYAWNELQQGGSSEAALTAVAFVLALFVCVVLHELGHALAARRYGVRTSDITLLPIGGVAHLERIPENPRQELAVALAGPAVNVAIASVMVLGLATGVLPEAAFLKRLLLANISLVLFNLLPAFPMDGGRVLRALLSMRMARVRATRIAVRIGQGFAAAAFLAGLFVNPMLMPLAVFVWLGASSEDEAARTQAMYRRPVLWAYDPTVRVRVIQVIR